jgi:hypothetical protein
MRRKERYKMHPVDKKTPLDSLRDRKENGKCLVCGEEIFLKAEPHKDHTPMTHPLIGEGLMHSRHLK